MKKVKQIANEIGVTRQAIHKKIKREPLKTKLQEHISVIDNTLTVSVDGEKLIKSAFKEKSSTTLPSTVNQAVNQTNDKKLIKSAFEEENKTNIVNEPANELENISQVLTATLQQQIISLTKQLEVKDRQLTAKDRQIDELISIIKSDIDSGIRLISRAETWGEKVSTPIERLAKNGLKELIALEEQRRKIVREKIERERKRQEVAREVIEQKKEFDEYFR